MGTAKELDNSTFLDFLFLEHLFSAAGVEWPEDTIVVSGDGSIAGLNPQTRYVLVMERLNTTKFDVFWIHSLFCYLLHHFADIKLFW